MHRLLVVGFSLAFFHISAQSITTPYSNFGIGELNSVTLPNQVGMGGVGVSTPHLYYINLQNPALLTYNVLTAFQVGLTADLRNYSNGTDVASDVTGSISHMVLSVPLIQNKWTSAVSLLPYSHVNYNLASTTLIDNTADSVTNFFNGEGGLSQVSWSHGISLGDFLNIGLRSSYVFGSITKNIGNTIDTDDITSTYRVNYKNFTNYSDIVFSASVAYKNKIGSSTFLHYGLIYDFAGSLSGQQSETLSRLTNTDAELSRVVVSEGIESSFQLPSKLSFGITYEKINKTLVGLDIKLLRWEDTNDANNSTLRNTLNVALGTQFTPDYKDVNSYLKRVDYRFGINYHQLPYQVNQTDINEIGINFGVSFPTKNFSSVDTGFRFGSRGSTENNLLRENFAQIVLGLSINDRWFIKRRYD